MKGHLANAIITGLSVLSFAGLSADTVVLKSGRTFTNVRANLGEKEIEIETMEGRVYVFPAGELKELQYGPVEKPKMPETKAVETDASAKKETGMENSEKTTTDPVTDCGYGTPVWESLLPVWSAHFCAGRTKLGIGFAVADTFLIYGFTQWAASKRTRNDDPTYFLTGLLLAARQANETDRLPVFLIWNEIGKDLIYTPQGLVLDRKTWMKRRNGVLALLLISMALDAGSVYWFATKPGSGNASTLVPRPFFSIFPELGRNEGTASAGVTIDF